MVEPRSDARSGAGGNRPERQFVSPPPQPPCPGEPVEEHLEDLLEIDYGAFPAKDAFAMARWPSDVVVDERGGMALAQAFHEHLNDTLASELRQLIAAMREAT